MIPCRFEKLLGRPVDLIDPTGERREGVLYAIGANELRIQTATIRLTWVKDFVRIIPGHRGRVCLHHEQEADRV